VTILMTLKKKLVERTAKKGVNGWYATKDEWSQTSSTIRNAFLLQWLLVRGRHVTSDYTPVPLRWGGARWRSQLRHYATNRKVAGSIPDGVVTIFHWHNPSGRTVALGSTQPLTEMSTRNISWGVKAAGA
jgi:hypothetical protein